MMQHLTYEKRVRIQSLLYDSGLLQYQVAKKIGVSPGTISNELKYFKARGELYNAKIADNLCIERRKIANYQLHFRVIKGTTLGDYILEKLMKFRSPEQIAGTRSKDNPEDIVSHVTIYNYIRDEHQDLIKKYFRRKGKKYKHGNGDKTKIPNRVGIEYRPKEVDEKIVSGHLEGDTIVGENKSDCIITIIERTTNFLFARVVHLQPGESLAIAVSTLMGSMIENVNPKLRKTLTLDNGTEFCDHEYITELTGIDVYFANPYHSWERGANENANGLLRQFLPKGSSFKGITQEQLDYYVNLINNRPRKKLNWSNPNNVFRSLSTI